MIFLCRLKCNSVISLQNYFKMVFHLSVREIEIAKEKFEAIDRNKNGFITFDQLTTWI